MVSLSGSIIIQGKAMMPVKGDNYMNAIYYDRNEYAIGSEPIFI